MTAIRRRIEALERERGRNGQMEPAGIAGAVSRYRDAWQGFGIPPERFGGMLASAPAWQARIWSTCEPEDFCL